MTQANHAFLVRWATYMSVGVALLLVLIKVMAWLTTGSVGLLATALDSTLDVLASFFILLAVRYAQQPADNEHRLGHGKAEPLASLAQSVFIAGSAVYLIVYAIDKLLNPQKVQQADVGMWVMLIAMTLTFMLIVFQRWVIHKTASKAIESDSLHYQTDLMANAAVFVGLWLSAYVWLDPLLGVLIGLWIGVHAIKLGFESAQQLLDRELDDVTKENIKQWILSVPEVKGFNDLRTYQAGPAIFIQLDLELEDDLTLLEAHRIAEDVTRVLKSHFDDVDVMIHQEPVSLRNDRKHHTWRKES